MNKTNGQTRVFDPAPLHRGLRRRGITADVLAKEIKADERTVYKALGGGSVNLTVLAQMCKALDVLAIRFSS